ADTAGRISERRLARPGSPSLPSADPRPRSEYGWPVAGSHQPFRVPMVSTHSQAEGRSWLDTVRHAANDHLRWLRRHWHAVRRLLVRRLLARRALARRALAPSFGPANPGPTNSGLSGAAAVSPRVRHGITGPSPTVRGRVMVA